MFETAIGRGKSAAPDVSNLASNLEGDFRAMRESTDFTAIMEELDRKALLMFPKASFITIGRWLEWGEFLTNALEMSSTVAPQMKSELAVIERDLPNAVSLREFLSAYGSASVRLRRKPSANSAIQAVRTCYENIAHVVPNGKEKCLLGCGEGEGRMYGWTA